MASYKLNQDAEDDLRQIYRYGILTFGAPQADKYFDALFEQFDAIAENPLRFASVDDIRTGYRRAVITSHSIYYRIIGDDQVEIMRILGRQNLGALE